MFCSHTVARGRPQPCLLPVVQSLGLVFGCLHAWDHQGKCGCFVLDMIKDAGDVAPYQQKRHLTSAGTSVTEKSKLLLRTISTRRNALSLKFLKKGARASFPFYLSTRKTVAHTVRERPSSQTATMLRSRQHLKEIANSAQLRMTSHSLPSPSRQKNRKRSEAEPAAPPFDVMQLLAKHI